MYYNSIYSQLFNFIHRYRFEKIVKKSGGDRYCKHFTAWKQFLTLLFAQISGKDSLREIENALLANHKRLYHLGMEAVAKSTLSEAMNRPPRTPHDHGCITSVDGYQLASPRDAAPRYTIILLTH